MTLVEQELVIWRSGGHVSKAQWASMEKALSLQPGEAAAIANKADSGVPNASASGNITPKISALDALRDGDSRPHTPTGSALDKDERDEFLKRENELTDQLAERELAHNFQEKQLKELREELGFLKEHETNLANNHKSISAELSERKLQVERLTYESKEAAILAEATKEQNVDLSNELDELRKSLGEMKTTQRSATNEGKERKRAEKLAQLMGSFDTSVVSEKEEQIRATLLKLDQAMDSEAALTADDMALLRRQLLESQDLAREQSEKVRQSMEDYDVLARRKDELEVRVAALEQECEELLDRGSEVDGRDIKVRTK